MSARRKRVISTDEIQFNHKRFKMLLTEKKGVSQNARPKLGHQCGCKCAKAYVAQQCKAISRNSADYTKLHMFLLKFLHDDVIKWKHYWPFVRAIHRSRWIPCTKASDAGLWCFLWSAPELNDWVNNLEAGDLRRHRSLYDVNVMFINNLKLHFCWPSNIFQITNVIFLQDFLALRG